MTDIPEKIQEIAADGVADGLHIVSEEALAAEQAVRGIEKLQIAYIGLGVAVGAAVGALVAFKVAYSRAETKFSQIADDEIAEMREHYQAKARALEGEAQKGRLEEIVAERGYVSNDDEKPPMAVSPPDSVVEAAGEAVEEAELHQANPAVPKVVKETEVRNVFRDADEAANVTESVAWDHHAELRRRSPDAPYVIHIDEKDAFEDYSDMSLTYYEADDVLCNERDEIVPHEERDQLVGEKNLNRFGHGSNDPSIVYIRNDRLEMVMEVVRSPNSYSEEVHGIRHTSYSRNLERMRQREREQRDDDS